MAALLRRWIGCDKGVSAVEFALAAPLLALMLVGLADYGLAVNEKMRLVSAARAGAQSAYGNSANVAAITNAVKIASGLDPAVISVAVSTSCGCADGTAVACGGGCASGAERSFTTVTVTESHTLLFDYPGFENPMPLAASATLRVK